MKEILFKNGKTLTCTNEAFHAIAQSLLTDKEFVFIHLGPMEENKSLVSVIRLCEVIAMYSMPTN
jgi:hypothetical protein